MGGLADPENEARTVTGSNAVMSSNCTPLAQQFCSVILRHGPWLLGRKNFGEGMYSQISFFAGEIRREAVCCILDVSLCLKCPEHWVQITA